MSEEHRPWIAVSADEAEAAEQAELIRSLQARELEVGRRLVEVAYLEQHPIAYRMIPAAEAGPVPDNAPAWQFPVCPGCGERHPVQLPEEALPALAIGVDGPAGAQEVTWAQLPPDIQAAIRAAAGIMATAAPDRPAEPVHQGGLSRLGVRVYGAVMLVIGLVCGLLIGFGVHG